MHQRSLPKLFVGVVLAAVCGNPGQVVEDSPAGRQRIATAPTGLTNSNSGHGTRIPEPAIVSQVTKTGFAPRQLETSHLPNAVRIHARVISGGQPDGRAGFRELQELGIRTIISVDGAPPDLTLAAQFGLRYVHLPHSYDGIPEQRLRELARAVSVLEGPIYIHCHHGRHRSPAAGAAACVSAGLIDHSAGLHVLRIAGTNRSYRGLFQSVASARRFEQAVLDSLPTDFPEKAELPRRAESMVRLEDTYDRLKQIAAAGWGDLPEHANTDPAHEALLLKEHFVEMLRLEHDHSDDAYREYLTESRDASAALETALVAWQQEGSAVLVPAAVAASLEQISRNCAACHQRFRDIPLSEKESGHR